MADYIAVLRFYGRKNYDYVSKLNSYAKDKLLKIDGVSLNSPENALPYVLNISAGKVRSETMLHFLENLEVYVSSGSAFSGELRLTPSIFNSLSIA